MLEQQFYMFCTVVCGFVKKLLLTGKIPFLEYGLLLEQEKQQMPSRRLKLKHFQIISMFQV